MNLSQAIEKHVQWKTKLRAAIASKETLDANAISKDDCCEVGKWLHGEGKSQHGQLVSFRQCVEKHAVFHVEAGRVAKAINAKRYDEAERMLGAGSSYTKASSDVGVAISRLKTAAKL
jgi:hypothetical protein